MRGLRALPLPRCVLKRKLEIAIDILGPIVSLRGGVDERGRYTSLKSGALLARAKDRHEPGSPAWIETEAAKLIYRAVIDDRKGHRTLVLLESGDPWDHEEEVLRRAARLIPLRLGEMASA